MWLQCHVGGRFDWDWLDAQEELGRLVLVGKDKMGRLKG